MCPAVWCWMRCLFQAHGYLLRENALPRILVETQATGETEAIEFDEEAYDLALGAMGEYDTARCLHLRLDDHADANHRL